MTLALAVPAAGLLIYAGLHDLAVRTVPNWLPAILLLIGIYARLLDHSLLSGLLAALAAFVFLFGIWAAGAMGGGDVKLWAATIMLVPPAWALQLVYFLHVVMLGGLLALVYLALSAVVARPRRPRAGGRLSRFLRAEQWRIARRGPLPYACAIAGGAIAAILPSALQT